MTRALIRKALTALQDAPYQPSRWTDALHATTELCQASSAQLLTFGHKQVPTLLAPGFSQDEIAIYIALRGPDPAVNRGVAQIHVTPALRVVADYEYLSDAERNADPLYNEFFGPHDGAFAAFGVLEHHNGLSSVLNLFHGARQGPITAEGKRALSVLLPRYAEAARLQIRLEEQAAAVSAATLDAVRTCALICDTDGRLVAATARAENALSRGNTLTVRRGRVTTTAFDDEPQLIAAIRGAARTLPPPHPSSIIVRSSTGMPARLDIAPMPSAHGPLTLNPLALVHIQEATAPLRLDAALLRKAFGLTAAEAQVAEALANGLASAQISQAREVSLETVNSQVKSILTKCACSRRSELPAILAPFSIA